MKRFPGSSQLLVALSSVWSLQAGSCCYWAKGRCGAGPVQGGATWQRWWRLWLSSRSSPACPRHSRRAWCCGPWAEKSPSMATMRAHRCLGLTGAFASAPPPPLPPNHRHRIATLNFEGAGCCLVPTSGHTWPSIWRPCLSTAESTSAEQGQPLLRRGSRELLLPRLRDRRIGAGQGSSSRGTLPRLCQTPRRTRSALWCTATLVALFVQSANSSPGAFQSDQHTIPHKHSAYDKRDDTTTHLHATSRQNCCRAD